MIDLKQNKKKYYLCVRKKSTAPYNELKIGWHYEASFDDIAWTVDLGSHSQEGYVYFLKEEFHRFFQGGRKYGRFVNPHK